MLFSDRIPEALGSYPDVSAFIKVLDDLQTVKKEYITEILRVNNPVLLTNRKWLVKKLADYGIKGIPVGYPIQILQQALLNINTLFSTRGSVMGLGFYCSLFSLGEVIIDDSEFYVDYDYLVLDSNTRGFLTADSGKAPFYLCSDSSEVEKSSKITIRIYSKYFMMPQASIIKDFSKSSIKSQLGFGSNMDIVFKFYQRTKFYYHELLNPYFV